MCTTKEKAKAPQKMKENLLKAVAFRMDKRVHYSGQM